uniref:Uncharacterized protein n=1 Tax=Siphoviridae sp. ct96x5 TaxID=2825367 RepID=A0A8S5PRV7_9CAUD|nr:MAG TPA: hypothetical protein [Siphoviridae sp. ct96x5]
MPRSLQHCTPENSRLSYPSVYLAQERKLRRV